MAYKDHSIKDIVKKISDNEVYLPAIQRKFVWSYEQIERLFDSIMLGYPIGTFLFWSLEKSAADRYTFYTFLRHFHERDNTLNEKAPTPNMKENIIGVLDGQQRLSSLYLALQGSYAYKKPRARWDNDEAFPIRELYFNLLKDTKDSHDDVTYSFKFLTEEESKVKDDNVLWFPVKTSLTWDDADDPMDYVTTNNLFKNVSVIKNLSKLWQRITIDKVINYFEVKNNDLDEILDIFIRVNSGGTVLSKSDLLFSTIIANWESGREKIENLIISINKKGPGFNFDTDFVMRACLVLMDSSVLFNIKNFKPETVHKIKNDWKKIEESIIVVVDFLVKCGFSKETLISKNAIIPIIYFVYKDGTWNEGNQKEFQKYLIVSLIKQIFGGKGDQVLESIRGFLRQRNNINNEFILKSTNFIFNDFKSIKLPADKNFRVDDDDLEEIFTTKKGAYSFMTLSILYPQLKFDQVQFHQDHIHPSASFNSNEFQKIGLTVEEGSRWLEIKDTLPNLQLLEGSENQSKKDTSFEIWFSKLKRTDDYKNTHYIPNTDLQFENFTEFYKQRKEILRSKLKTFF